MFGQNPFGGADFGNSPIPSELSLSGIVFNGFSLESGLENDIGVIVKTWNRFDEPSIEVNSFRSAFADGGGVFNRRYPQRTISLTVCFKAPTKNEALDLLDNFKKDMSKVEGDFSYQHKTGERRTLKATLDAINFVSQRYEAGFIFECELVFVSFSPHFRDTEDSFVNFGTITTTTTTLSLINEGSYKAKARIKLIFANSGNSGITGLTLSINDFDVDFDEAIENNDVIIIDSENNSITKNGVKIAKFQGSFDAQEIEPGGTQAQITCKGATSVNYEVSVLTPKIYL